MDPGAARLDGCAILAVGVQILWPAALCVEHLQPGLAQPRAGQLIAVAFEEGIDLIRARRGEIPSQSRQFEIGVERVVAQ